MKSASTLSNESARLAALRRYAILDTAAEVEFDDCTRLAAQLCSVPGALISLVDEDRQWFKSRIGVELLQTPRANSFCSHAILNKSLFVVPDALLDERFRDHPQVQDGLKIRFYAAAPLITPEGFCIGTLCVIDHGPRQLTTAQGDSLIALGRQVVAQLELRRRQLAAARPRRPRAAPGALTRRRPQRGKSRFEHLIGALPQIVWTATPHRPATYLNSRWTEYTGLTEASPEAMRQVIHPDDYDQLFSKLDACRRSRAMYTAEFRMKPAGSGEYRWFISRAVPADPASARADADSGDYTGEWLGVTTDIHELKLAEAALRESAQRLRIVAQVTSDAIWDWDLRTNQILWNEGLTELFGYPLGGGEHDPQWWLDRIHPEDRHRVESRLHELVSSQAVRWEDTYRFRCAGGAYANIYDRARVVRGSDGQATRLLGAMQDITKRHQAELSLRQSEERYARAVRGTSDGLWDWNIVTGEAYLSPRWKQLLGFTDDELPNHESSFYSRVHPEDRQRVHESEQAHFYQGVPLDFEVRLRSRSGEYRWFRTRGQVEHNAQGEPVRMAGAISDITQHKAAELALRLRDRAIQAVSQGIVITDATLPDNPIIYVSPAFERLTGYSAAELLMRNCRFLQGKDTDPAVVAVLREAIAEKRPCSVELLNYRKDQTPFWNALTVAPIKEGDQVTHFVGIQTDITARRQLEDRFHQAQKMEAIGRLAGGIAHDFNNLLTIINGYSDMLLAELSPSMPQRSEIAEIREAGRRAAGLTAQLLALSRKTMVKPKVLDLNAVIESRAQMFGRLFADDISVRLELAPKLSRIKADPGQLEQVIINLVMNARDAMAHGGRLTLSTRDIEHLAQNKLGYHDYRPGRYVQLCVADTGCGMSDEVKAKLFEPFFTTKEAGKGTGLGLATVYGIVQQSSGYISVESELDKGTTIQVLFPAVSEPPPRPAKEAVVQPPTGAVTILVVDDEEAVRKLACLVLKAHGYEVLEASSGAEALRLSELHRGAIHLLLTDVVMPQMSGREVAAALRMVRPELKVVYMSGYTDDSVVRNRVSEAANSFLPKPFAPHDLAKRIRAVLDEPTLPAK